MENAVVENAVVENAVVENAVVEKTLSALSLSLIVCQELRLQFSVLNIESAQASFVQ